jgi:hypothetical protein
MPVVVGAHGGYGQAMQQCRHTEAAGADYRADNSRGPGGPNGRWDPFGPH